VLALKQQQASAEALLPQLQQAQQQAAHLLAVLGGHPPAAIQPPAPSLAELRLPQRLPLSLPAELVRQRPDVLAAEAELHARSAGIGVATAAMLPGISLSAGFGRSGADFGALGSPAAAFWSSGAALTAPLFEGGTLWYQRRAAVEAYRQSLAGYRQTVLEAFAQVADALRALQSDALQAQAQASASEAAGQGLELAQANFDAGTIGSLELAAARDQALQARLALVQAQARQLQDTAALFVALGGGWWNAPAGLPDAAAQ
jgi:NodT family efflux transporter outer membrane factor (OMF) lipoprotein